MAIWLKHLDTGQRWELSERLENVIGRDPRARVSLTLASAGAARFAERR